MGDYRRDTEVISYDKDNSRTILKTDSIVDSIIDSFVDRASFGKKKYGKDMDRDDLSLEQWIQHAIEECMDNLLYLRKIQTIISGKK